MRNKKHIVKKSSKKKKRIVEPMLFEEFEQIVEFSYNNKNSKFVIRFLNGDSYSLDTASFPKSITTKKPDFDNCSLAPGRNALCINTSIGIQEVPSNIIHCKGNQIK